MNRNPIQRIHIFSRKVNDMISQKAQELREFFNQYQVSCTIIDTNQIPKEKPDMVFVLGGDGTFYRQITVMRLKEFRYWVSIWADWAFDRGECRGLVQCCKSGFRRKLHR